MTRPPEPTLRVLLDLVRREPSVSFGITLLTGGVLVSGRLVNFSRYIEQMGGMFERATGSGRPIGTAIASGLRTALDQAADELRTVHESGPPDTGGTAPKRLSGPEDWFYMEDVTLVQGRLPMRLPVWSGRVEDIAGWMLGTVNLS